MFLEFEEFMEATLSTFRDYEKAVYGWSVENDIPVIGAESKRGKVLVVFIRLFSVGASNEALLWKANCSKITWERFRTYQA